ncbi:MAG TPA: adenosylhomocysteinase [Microbacteriaceae bacterium]|jgi:adenosylhomocysteinase|nr:adenosylhomocysteinase [Microbacteriaceae bacterium]
MTTQTTAHTTATHQTAAQAGAARIEWIRSRMSMLATLRGELAQTRPFVGHRIGMSLHLEPKTAVLLETLAAGGAEIVATGNHGSTQDDVVAALREQGMTLFGRRDDSIQQHAANVDAVLDAHPDILLDNGGDLAAGIVARGAADSIIGGTEETTSGGLRLRGELAGALPFPVIVINDSMLKAIGENRHAVGQSVVESFMRITNVMVPGRHVLVAGYGWCGRGIAQSFRALGAQVAVAEIDELKAFEAALDGFRVGALGELVEWADVVITATGQPGVVGSEAFGGLRDGAILANSGHFPWEIDVQALREQATSTRTIADAVERVDLADGRHVILLADGRMVNLAGRDPKGNSLEAMDLGFMLQVLSLERVATGADALQPGPQPVPNDIERRIARAFLAALDSGR